MRNSQLSSISTEWDDRNLFRKRRPWVKYLWMLALIASAMAIYHERDEIPDLLLGGFKLIAHAMPAQPIAPLDSPAPLD